MRWLMVGRGDARYIARALDADWMPLDATTDPARITGRAAVVNGTLSEARRVVRARPSRLVWRPTNQRLPLPRGLSWMISRVDAVVAADSTMADALRSAGVKVVTIPPAIAVRPRRRRRPESARRTSCVRLAVTLDQLDHSVSAGMAMVEALVAGATGAPRFDHRSGRVTVAPGRTPAPVAISEAYIHVVDGGDAPEADTYLDRLRCWHGVESLVRLDADGDERPTDDQSLARRLGDYDLHVTNTGLHGPSRMALVAGAAGLVTVMPDPGGTAQGEWIVVCAHRSECVADGSVRIHLDIGAAVRAIHAIASDDSTRARLAAAATEAATIHHVDELIGPWIRLLGDSRTSQPFRRLEVV